MEEIERERERGDFVDRKRLVEESEREREEGGRERDRRIG